MVITRVSAKIVFNWNNFDNSGVMTILEEMFRLVVDFRQLNDIIDFKCLSMATISCQRFNSNTIGIIVFELSKMIMTKIIDQNRLPLEVLR